MDSSFSHIAVLVHSVAESAKFLNSNGLQTGKEKTFASEGTKEIYVGSYNTHAGLLLLVEAISDGPYSRALKKRGPSLHHIALDVLNIEEFSIKAQSAGWQLHPISAQTIENKTAWFFLKGVPTLIEIHQKKQLAINPFKVSKIEIPIENKHVSLFAAIGMGDLVFCSKEICLTADNHKFSFSQIACLR